MQRKGCLGIIAIWVCMTPMAVANTLLVPEDHGTVQAAIDAGRDGDTVLVNPGEYVIDSPISFGGKAITLRATQGPEHTVIRMAETPASSELAAVVIFVSMEDEKSVLEGFTLTGGQGVRWGDEPHQQRGGGGVYCELEVRPRIVDCRITGNSSQIGGGVLSLFGASPTLIDCDLSENTTEISGGGAAFIQGSPTLTRCNVRNNVARSAAAGQGGGLFFSGTTVNMEGCVIAGNLAQGANAIGGGILIASSTGRISDSLIRYNVSLGDFGNGGGLGVLEGATPILRSCEISSNVGGIRGGLDCYLGGSPILENCRIIGNVSTHEFGGGGVRCWQSAPTLKECLIAGNTSTWGSGVQCFEATPEIVNCVIVGNIAELGGGGVQFSVGSNGFIRNSTITGNATRVDSGGGVNCFDSTPKVVNSIVWGNEPGSICGEVTSSVAEDDPLFVEMGEFQFDRFQEVEIGGLPRLIPDFIVRLGDYRLKEGSPAIDQATSDQAPMTDILANERCGVGADIGAYEYVSAECAKNPFRRGDIELNGKIDITDAIAILFFLFSGGANPPCLRAADVDDDGDVNVTDAVFLFEYLFQGKDAPVEPFVECGTDTTPDDLTCEMATCTI